MGVKVIDRIYKELYTNDETDWLLGNVGDQQTLNVKVEVGIEYLASNSELVQIDNINNAFILTNGKSWGEYGFDAGMNIVFSYTISEDTTGDGNFDLVQTQTESFEIQNIAGSTMEIDGNIDLDEYDNVPTNFGTKKISDVIFYVEENVDGCKVRIGQIPNDDQSESLISVNDGTTTEFISSQLGNLALGQWADLEAIGKQSGLAIKKAKVRQLSNNAAGDSGTLITGTSEEIESGVYENPVTDEVNYFSLRAVPLGADAFALANGFSNSEGGFVPIPNNSLGEPGNGDVSQSFYTNVATDHTRSLYLNISFQITGIIELNEEPRFRLVLLKYTNGGSMNYVSKQVIQEYSNLQPLINEQLNYTGIIEIEPNATDSYVLAFEYAQLDANNDNNYYHDGVQGVKYVINSAVMKPSAIGENLSVGSKKVYEFQFDYVLPFPFEDISNFQDSPFLVPEYLEGDGSLKDNFLFEFFPEWNNPNVKIKNDVKKTERLGNTGWFNENFNQLDNDFSVESVQYLDLNGSQVDSLDYSQATKVKAVINGVPNLTSLSRFGVGFCWVPENPDDFKDLETPMHQNLLMSLGKQDGGFWINSIYNDTFFGFGINGVAMNLKNVKFSEQNDKVVFEGIFEPTANFFSFFENREETDRNFILWLSLADSQQTERRFSDRVSLLIDFNQMEKSVVNVGSYDKMDNRFIEHPYDFESAGVVLYEGFVQDDLLSRVPFRLPKDQSIKFENMAFGFEAFNQSTNESFELENIGVPLNSFPVDSNGVHQINVNETRNFIYKAGSEKNWIKIVRSEDLDTVAFNGYIAYFGSKIRYEDWLQKTDAPGYFFNQDEPNSGLNNDWINYLNANGWTLNFYVRSLATENGSLVEYTNRFPIVFKDYDKNDEISTSHRYKRSNGGQVLNVGNDPETGKPLGVILQNEFTEIEVDFTLTGSGVWDLQTVYGVMTIEPDKGGGSTQMRQFSTVLEPESDTPFFNFGNDFLIKTLDGTAKTLTLKALIDPDVLENAKKYRITARVGCFDAGAGNFEPGLYEFRYEETYQ